MARPRFTIPTACIPSVQRVSLAAWTVRLAITTARLRPRTIRARMLRLGMLTTTAMAWAMRVTAKLRARNQQVMWPTAPTCAMTRRLATTMTATMAHVSRLTSVVFAVDRAFPLVIATATATSWMRWAYAVVRALRIPTATVCVMPMRLWVARMILLATTMQTLRTQVPARIQIQVTIAAGLA